MGPWRDPSDSYGYGYLEAVRRAREAQPTGVRLGNLQREFIPPQIDWLDVQLALWTCEAMVAEDV